LVARSAPAARQLSELGERIAGEIRATGVITFARFMELALYCPNYGYYEREEDIVGRHGDYYTSVSVGSLFGELLAFQFAQWLQEGEGPRPEGPGTGGMEAMRIVEAGAHGGDLARDILAWLRENHPRLFHRVEYWIVEPSATRQEWQQRKLAELGNKVRWVGELASLTGRAFPHARVPPPVGVRGVFFSNEFLDAMPMHRLGWDAKARVWFEWGVTYQAGRFVWTRIEDGGTGGGDQQSSPSLSISHSQMPIQSAILEILPDGFTTEVSPAADRWWRQAGMALNCGKLIAIDYGLTAEEFLMPERKDGTLRGYHRHRLARDVLANPGQQDITAQVNFTAIRTAGESAGLRTDAFLTQAQFLTSIAARTWKDEDSFGKWTPERTRQFQTLTHPEHLGRSFRVLVQERCSPSTPKREGQGEGDCSS
jgi:SAM-dependent MidA family methyltransferase